MGGIFKNDLFKIGLYFAMTAVLGSLLAPPLFFAGKSIAASGVLADSAFGPLRTLSRIMEETRFQRYFNRAVLLAALVCLIPLVKSLGIRGRAALALDPDPRRWRHFAMGFGLAAGLLLLMGWIFLQTGVYEVRLPGKRPGLGEILRTAITSGIAVGLLEEFLFRGMMLGICLSAARRGAALFFVTFLFAAVHFMKPPEGLTIEDSEVHWGTGFWLASRIFAQFGNPLSLISEFATLFAVGWVLGVVRLRTRSLWASIGLHAGWVFGLKSFSALTRRGMPLDATLPWIGSDLKTGLVPLAMVALTGVLITLWLRRERPRAGAP